MLKNYFKIAWRNLFKNPLYSVVSIGGLFVGITFSLLIGGYVWQEFQVNEGLNNVDNQYILTSDWKNPNMGIDFTSLAPLSKALKDNYPTLIENYYRLDGINVIISNKNDHFRESVQIWDSTLIAMYGFKMLYGNPKTALLNPNAIVLSAEKAQKYFGRTNVVNETLSIENFSGERKDFLVTGVLKKIPKNLVTNLSDNYVNEIFLPQGSLSFFGRDQWEDWSYNIIPSYVELKNGIGPTDLTIPIQQLIKKNADQRISENLKVNVVPLKEFYLEKDNHLVKRMLYTLSFVGLFILLMAIINFINISVAHSSKRMMEIGVRKVMGGRKTQLVYQFLTESIVFVFIATFLALLCYPLAKPWFGQLIGKQIPELSSFPMYFIGIPLLIILIVGFLAGIYPAMVLASLNAVESLKGRFKKVTTSIVISKSLIGFQFIVALTVLITTAIISQQVDYFFGNSLGYNKQYVISASVPRDWSPEGVEKMETIRNEFAAMKEVNEVSLSYEIPNGNFGFQLPIHRFNDTRKNEVPMQSLVADSHYLDTYQIPLAAGTFFRDDMQVRDKVVINEKAQRLLGWESSEKAIGQYIKIPEDTISYMVIGVIKDFHFGSMADNIEPQVIFNPKTIPNFRYLSFKLRPGNVESSIKAVRTKWSSLLPNTPFEYIFIDDTLKKLYSNELQLKNAAYTSCWLSLIIVLLGVFGLVSMSINKRIKEIGIRKVLGASLQNISFLFIREFVSVFMVAILIACPVAYALSKMWLHNYAYQIEIAPKTFIWSVLLVTGIILALIVMQTKKASNRNPAKNLRTE
ncbi:ABC transporter permease [Flavobacteriaceae bacterium F89]|uniref:ABC transporter permease n=1 Tax=Cerina litoralis TaxID=2874477 RepID=A0AAE3JRY1_9FLAO|nr:FtsX-like permease family protein [Cerina litoralis]MCG2460082.1 ABC transporter permease [Cerina litoralis]